MKNKFIQIIIILLAAIVLVFAVRLIFNIHREKTELETAPSLAAPYIYKDLIKIDSPVQNQKITSPIPVKGEARGNWYFEAIFPIQVLDGDGTILGSGQGKAQGEWTTTNYVPFTGEIIFSKPKSKTGIVVFKKDNPSGIPKNDDSVSIPINFE